MERSSDVVLEAYTELWFRHRRSKGQEKVKMVPWYLAYVGRDKGEDPTNHGRHRRRADRVVDRVHCWRGKGQDMNCKVLARKEAEDEDSGIRSMHLFLFHCSCSKGGCDSTYRPGIEMMFNGGDDSDYDFVWIGDGQTDMVKRSDWPSWVEASAIDTHGD
ncbi:hypothetical protein DM02DRAFT_189944 [Periconia macrospinosa]|uniref:Uncharacterized protein n=1 Tax=Periconia macrospinosa TaxID=97972 RepID=A0A2V1DBC5_9PLEO|nr:hypothetical protein DM02DRAFT_189944 [Periconia macrospinosa]